MLFMVIERFGDQLRSPAGGAEQGDPRSRRAVSGFEVAPGIDLKQQSPSAANFLRHPVNLIALSADRSVPGDCTVRILPTPPSIIQLGGVVRWHPVLNLRAA